MATTLDQEPSNQAQVAAQARMAAAQAREEQQRRPSQSWGVYHRAWVKLRRDPLTLAAAGILILVTLISLLAPVIATNILGTNPEEIMRTPDGRIAILQPPGPGYPLGTDDLGRDVLTRLLYAGRVSLSIGFLVAILSVFVGTSTGLMAGYFGKWVDDVVNAIVQFVFNVPGLFLLILLSVIFRPSVAMLALIFAFFSWPGTTRQVRGVVLSVRTLDYVTAAEALGATPLRVMLHHVLPNVGNVVMVGAAFTIAGAILGESALSFLGFGVQPPLASWGNMLSGGQDLFRRAPWLVYPPGLMIFITVLSVVLLADGLRDAFDPRV